MHGVVHALAHETPEQDCQELYQASGDKEAHVAHACVQRIELQVIVMVALRKQ